MKKLIGVMTLLSLLMGCGPEQTSSDKDQQQIDAEAARLNALYIPFKGTYKGTWLKQDGTSYQAEFILNVFYNSQPNASRLTNTNYPTLSGSFNVCLVTSCWTTNLDDQQGADQIGLGGAQPDSSGEMVFVTNPNQSTCTDSIFGCNAVTVIIRLSNNNNSLAGTATGLLNNAGTLSLTRVQ